MRRPSFFDEPTRRRIVERLRGLTPATPARWGKMNAPRMVAHLTDQMSHTLGDVATRPVPGILRWRPVRAVVLYWLPWPRGRAKGPPEAFVTRPAEWSTDLERLVGLVERMGGRDPGGEWPDHALFGRMSGDDWGFFCQKHFDHHLRQFGV
ncbi:MAG: DUF1569 domain-containing protein [Thermoanaerobaculia bacterium]|nr:DUF1569 domain-containing protein [Thermoanaerobaculia bacterium]